MPQQQAHANGRSYNNFFRAWNATLVEEFALTNFQLMNMYQTICLSQLLSFKQQQVLMHKTKVYTEARYFALKSRRR